MTGTKTLLLFQSLIYRLFSGICTTKQKIGTDRHKDGWTEHQNNCSEMRSKDLERFPMYPKQSSLRSRTDRNRYISIRRRSATNTCPPPPMFQKG